MHFLTVSLNLLSSFSLIGFSVLGLSQLGYSQATPSRSNPLNSQVLFNAPTPPDQGAPEGRQQGGASRGGTCYEQYGELTALVPITNGVVWSLTSSQQPTLWFYLPSPLTTSASVEFVLQDETNDYVYETTITGVEVPAGLMSLSVPASHPLTMDQAYYWTLAITCGTDSLSEAIFVSGTLKRNSLDSQLQRQIGTASPLDQVKLYAANGIWHEALTTSAQLYQANPNDRQVAEVWQSLLQQVNLESFTTVPFAPCCTN